MLKTNLCKIQLKNPTILASGILGVTKESINRIGKAGAGAVTIKSLATDERKGHPSPTMFVFPGGMLNAVGLPGQGVDSAANDFKRLDDVSVPVIGSVFSYTIKDFGVVTKKIAQLKPAMIELNVSCPNINYHMPFWADAHAIKEITALAKENAGKIPISVKLSPNVYNFTELALAAQDAGADCITAINTAIGMQIDIDVRKPILSNKSGGLSGPALKPIAIRCVYDAYKALKIPIIGTGGITTGRDAIEMTMAGATGLGIGTAVYYRGTNAFKLICDEMQDWMKEHNVKRLDDIRGAAHEQ